ncbi:response regulator [Hyphomicrobium sp.]|uniref:response regulator n=1 Tax=Hyphomicrobium sp. TaxID=82 RepID=UPI003F7074FA
MPRFFVLEDEPLIAAMLADWLEQQGHSVVALAHTASEALAIVDRLQVDAAILDIKVRDGAAYPVAEKLRQRRIPFLFATACEKSGIEAEFRQEMWVCKPFEFDVLSEKLHDVLARGLHRTLAEGGCGRPQFAASGA